MESINISFVQKIQTTSNLLCVCMIFLFPLEYFFFTFHHFRVLNKAVYMSYALKIRCI